MNDAVRRVRARVEDVVGPLGGYLRHRARRGLPRSIEATVARVGPEVLADPPPDDPIFVFSAGWRSGSTLLQRLALSSDQVLMWGEPWGRCDHVPRLSEALTAVNGAWPPPQFIIEEEHGSGRDYARQWVAAMFPSAADLLEAHRSFFRALYADPARKRGFQRWGVKEVRYGIEEARYLHLLFPRARFVFLHRNPYDAWSSYRAVGFAAYARFPDDPVLNARRYGTLWRDLTEGFVQGADDVGGVVVGYDQLGDPECLQRLGRHLDVEIDPSAGRHHIGGASRKRLSPIEVRILRRAVEPLAGELGYHPPDLG